MPMPAARRLRVLILSEHSPGNRGRHVTRRPTPLIGRRWPPSERRVNLQRRRRVAQNIVVAIGASRAVYYGQQRVWSATLCVRSQIERTPNLARVHL